MSHTLVSTLFSIPSHNKRTPGSTAYKAILLFSLLLAGLSAPNSYAQTTRCEPWTARIESIEGSLQIQFHETNTWQEGQVGDSLCPGDGVQIHDGRAALRLQNDTVLRADAGTHIVLTKTEKPSLLKLLKGLIYLITRTPQSFTVETKYVNAYVEGTEFLVAADDQSGRVVVFEGTVVASNALGEERVFSGSEVIATARQKPRKLTSVKIQDSVQWALYYPPIIKAAAVSASSQVLSAEKLLYKGDLSGAWKLLQNRPEAGQSAAFYNFRASVALYMGQVQSAAEDIKQALSLDSNSADALALQTLAHIVKGELDAAQTRIQQALQQPPQASVYLAQSYLQQARFELKTALASARQAVKLQPDNALAWARRAELALTLGKLKEANLAAEQARLLEPELSRAQTIAGFVLLKKLKFNGAKAAFDRAARLAPSDPLPQLGLGLIAIRKNRLEKGRAKLELATALDPANSLLRSYLGKAYFDERRNPLAVSQFELAQNLDPRDPTPWFYQAILKQTENRPAAALQDLQQSIELNDNRAVYRSRLLLDADEAARNASQAKIYQELGFNVLAQQKAAQSLSTSPVEHGAHKLLAESYINNPRFDTARSSEILQAQLLQPLTATPIRSTLAERDLLIIEGTGPSDIGFNEFNTLFNSETDHVQFAGVGGSNGTGAGELLVSGMHGPVAYAGGHYIYETDGFRINNDIEYDISTAYAQIQLRHNLNIQLEARHREEKRGDVAQRFLENTFSESERKLSEINLQRIGFRYMPTSNIDLIGSLDFIDVDLNTDLMQADTQVIQIGPFPVTIENNTEIQDESKSDTIDLELQFLLNRPNFNIIAGLDIADIDLDTMQVLTFNQTITPPIIPPLPQPPPSLTTGTTNYENAYFYWHAKPIEGFTSTLGVANENLEDIRLNDEISEWNPKLGVKWQSSRYLTLRAAMMQTMAKPTEILQSLEPTQVAGFNQPYDDTLATISETYGIALDFATHNYLYVGAEFVQRDLSSPVLNTSSSSTRESLSEETTQTLYFNWAKESWAYSLHYHYEKYEREEGAFVNINRPSILNTRRIPLQISYNYGGISTSAVASHINQKGSFGSPSGEMRDENDFWILDLSLEYEFFLNRAKLSLEVNNALDEEFKFQDTNFQDGSPRPLKYTPERTLVGRLSLYL